MIRKGSRYEKVKEFKADPVRKFFFQGARAREIPATAGILEHVVKEGERLDLLALHYYSDVHKWWRILDANPEIMFGGEIEGGSLNGMAGKVILVPRASD